MIDPWRIHLDDKGKWWYCADADCERDHHLYRPFSGIEDRITNG